MLKFLFYLSERTLFHKRSDQFVPFIRMLAIMGLIIGTIAMSITLGILRGFENNLVEKITGFEAHIRIESFKNSIEYDPEYVDQLFENQSITKITPYVDLETMLRKGDETEGIIIECMNEADFLEMLYRSKKNIAGGVDFREGQDQKGLYIGRGVAEYLNINVGDTVSALFIDGIPSPFNPIRSYGIIVTGIFSTGMKEFDANFAYASLDFAADIKGNENIISGYQLLLQDPLLADDVSNWINQVSQYHYIPVTWRERNIMLFKWLQTQKAPIVITFGIIALVAIVNIISTLVMIVLVKERDTSILKSMGMKPADIQKKFMIDGLSISIMGIGVGIFIAKFLEWGQMRFAWIKLSADVYFIDRLPIEISWDVMLIIVLVAVATSLIATFLPARNASLIKPIEVLRYE
ncbi:MAG: FtsX-like permease family protein [Candidatus Marinimicrobia bacterium]|nr:FtsX-like permease family protein [Candidatus Neomarinimicrobiota bacterium]